MPPRVPYDVAELDVWIRPSEYDPPKAYVSVPDALEIVVSRRSSSTSRRFVYTCLDHLFELLNRIERRESGRVLAGTGVMDVTVENETVTLYARPRLVGTVEETKAVVLRLIASVFEELAGAGLDTRERARDVADRRSLTVDPIAVHDSVMN